MAGYGKQHLYVFNRILVALGYHTPRWPRGIYKNTPVRSIEEIRFFVVSNGSLPDAW